MTTQEAVVAVVAMVAFAVVFCVAMWTGRGGSDE